MRMLNQNKNRGAGLVTVVAVLAIASILLSGSIFLAFNHYKNVINDEIAEEALAEIELCAEVICVELSDKELSTDSFWGAFADGSFVHLFFAGLSEEELSQSVDYFRIIEDEKIIAFEDFKIENIVLAKEDEVSKVVATISYRGISRSVSFYHNQGKWSLVCPEVDDET